MKTLMLQRVEREEPFGISKVVVQRMRSKVMFV